MAKIPQTSSVVNPLPTSDTSKRPISPPPSASHMRNKREGEDPILYSEREASACTNLIRRPMMNRRSRIVCWVAVPCHKCDGCRQFKCEQDTKEVLSQFEGQPLYTLEIQEVNREQMVADLRRWGFMGKPVPMPDGRRLVLTNSPMGVEVTGDRAEVVLQIFTSRAWDRRRAKPFGDWRKSSTLPGDWVLVTHDQVEQEDVDATADLCEMPRDSSGRLILLPLSDPTMQSFLEWAGFDLTRRCREVLGGVQVVGRVA